MTKDEIYAEFGKFIEYPGSDKKYVTTVSTLLFAEHIANMVRIEYQTEIQREATKFKKETL